MVDQLVILSENLDDKITVLECIKAYNINQKNVLMQEEFQADAFDSALDEKEYLIQKLEALDEGFDEIYQGVSDQIQGNKKLYADQIRDIQCKISRINELSAEIDSLESENKALITGHFDKMKAGIKQSRQGSKAAYDYYRNMSGAAYATNQMMDSKF